MSSAPLNFFAGAGAEDGVAGDAAGVLVCCSFFARALAMISCARFFLAIISSGFGSAGTGLSGVLGATGLGGAAFGG